MAVENLAKARGPAREGETDVAMEQDEADKPRGRAQGRKRRWLGGTSASAAVLAALALTIALNGLSARRFARWDCGGSGFYRLSDKTEQLIASLTADVDIIVFLRPGQALYEDVRNLLAEYAYAAGKRQPVRLRVERVDPDRDLSRMRELKRECGLSEE